MFFIQLAVFYLAVVRVLPLQDRTHFLRKGCTIKRTYKETTFKDSVFFHMLFPPHTFHFSVDVDQRGTRTQIRLKDDDDEGLDHQQTWMMMELVLKDRVEVRFSNGSVWLESHNEKMNREPRKIIRMRGGHFMSHCPEETPNWTLQLGVEDRPLLIGEKGELLSFFPNHPTKIYLVVGKEELVLCWDATSNVTVVMSAPLITTICDPLPAFTLFWLQLVYRDPLFVISHPEHSQPMRTFHLDNQVGSVTFKSDSVKGVTYVVHHLKAATVNPLNTGDSEEPELCLKITLPIMIVTGLLLLVSGCLSGVFYHRWTKARKVLYLLRSQDKITKSIRLTEPPGPPSRPPPSLITQNHYMIPREVMVKSEHMYEDMNWLPDAKATESHENTAFDNTKTESK